MINRAQSDPLPMKLKHFRTNFRGEIPNRCIAKQTEENYVQTSTHPEIVRATSEDCLYILVMFSAVLIPRLADAKCYFLRADDK